MSVHETLAAAREAYARILRDPEAEATAILAAEDNLVEAELDARAEGVL